MEAGRLRRVAQFEKDRLEALTALDPEQWSVFCLRWALQEPDDAAQAMIVMHRLRLSIETIPAEMKAASRDALSALGALPDAEDPLIK